MFMDGLPPPSGKNQTKVCLAQDGWGAELLNKGSLELHFRAVTFRGASHTGAPAESNSLLSSVERMQQTAENVSNTTEPHVLRDRETQEPSAGLCLKIRLLLRKIEDQFPAGFFFFS